MIKLKSSYYQLPFLGGFPHQLEVCSWIPSCSYGLATEESRNLHSFCLKVPKAINDTHSTNIFSCLKSKVGIGSFHYVHIESYVLIIFYINIYIYIVLSYFQTGPPNSRNKHMCHQQKEHVAQDWLFRCPQQATGISDWCAIFGFHCFHCSLGRLVTCRNQESHVGMAKQWRTCWCFQGGST